MEKIKEIFRDNKNAYLAYADSVLESREFLNFDMEAMTVDIVKIQNQGKIYKVQKLKLLERFNAHKLSEFKDTLLSLLDELMKSLYPRPTLSCAYDGDQPITQVDVVDKVAHAEVLFISMYMFILFSHNIILAGLE